jgi:hypothetical protein
MSDEKKLSPDSKASDIDPLGNPAIESALGGLRRYENGRIATPDGRILVEKDGSQAEAVADARDKRDRANETLWRVVGPLRYGDVVLQKNTEVYHDKREEWWRADTLEFYSSGAVAVDFYVKGSKPRRSVTVTGETLADLVGDGILLSKGEFESRIQELIGGVQNETHSS